jgi:hypothetical protein
MIGKGAAQQAKYRSKPLRALQAPSHSLVELLDARANPVPCLTILEQNINEIQIPLPEGNPSRARKLGSGAAERPGPKSAHMGQEARGALLVACYFFYYYELFSSMLPDGVPCGALNPGSKPQTWT